MPVRKESVTEADEAAPETPSKNVVAEIVNDIGATNELVMHQQEMIEKLAAEVEALRAGKADAPVIQQQAVYEPAPLAEGAKRYAARYTEHTMMRVGTGHEMHGGVAVPVPIITGKPIDFNGGVYETADPEEQEFIENHPDYGMTVWEDPTAVRRHSQVEVVDGMKGTVSTPRVPLSAPMGP